MDAAAECLLPFISLICNRNRSVPDLGIGYVSAAGLRLFAQLNVCYSIPHLTNSVGLDHGLNLPFSQSQVKTVASLPPFDLTSSTQLACRKQWRTPADSHRANNLVQHCKESTFDQSRNQLPLLGIRLPRD